MPDAADTVVANFTAELETWRAERPGWTPREQLTAWSPHRLWMRAGGGVIDLDTGRYAQVDPDLYRRLMIAAGYLVPRQPGDDGHLPCGWPRERAGG
jgi:hypothetical protein